MPRQALRSAPNAFSRVGSWRETAAAAPLSAKARRCGGGRGYLRGVPLQSRYARQLPQGAPFGVAAKFAATAKAVPLGKVAKPQALTEGVTSGQANFALKPETLPPCQRLPPRGSCQNRQVLTEGVKLPPWGSCRAATEGVTPYNKKETTAQKLCNGFSCYCIKQSEQDQTSSRTAISAASPRRAPILMMRV